MGWLGRFGRYLVFAGVAAASLGLFGVPPASAAGGTVTLGQDTGLVDGQLVTLNGFGFDPNVAYATAQCTTDLRQCSDERGSVGSESDGSLWPGHAIMRRYVTYDDNGVTQQVDCASAPRRCSIFVYASQPGDRASAPISFTGVVTLDHDADLVDGQRITVGATGLEPDATYSIAQCTSDLHTCSDERKSVDTGNDGSFTATTITVHTDLSFVDSDGQAQTVDCTVHTRSCVIAVSDLTGSGDTASAAIAFKGHVMLGQDTNLTDGQQVTLNGYGFEPNGVYVVAACTSDLRQCGDDRGSVGSDSDGRLDPGYVDVPRYVTYVDGNGATQQIDCAATAGRCVIAVFQASHPDQLSYAPVSFTAPK